MFRPFTVIAVALLLGACGSSSSQAPSPTPDVGATEVAATVTAREVEAAVDAAVQARLDELIPTFTARDVAAAIDAAVQSRLDELLPTITAPAPSAPSAAPGTSPPVAERADLVSSVRPAVIRIDASTPMGVSTGSGVIYDARGLAITNQHVLAGASSVMVTIRDTADSEPRIFNAQVLGSNAERDLAVIRIDGDGFLALSLGGSSDVAPGDEVLALGFPLGLEGDLSVSRGIVSRRFQSMGRPLIQHDAKILPGNSGGPLLTRDGTVVGINTFVILDPSRTTAEGLNMAIGAEDFVIRLASLEAGDELGPGESTEYVNAAYGLQFAVPAGWTVIEDSPELVFAFDPNTGAVVSVELDEDTSRFGDDEIWARYWFFAGRTFVDQDTYQVIGFDQGTRPDGTSVAFYEELFSRPGDRFMSRGLKTFIYKRGFGTRVYFEAPAAVWDQVLPIFMEVRASLMEPEPPVDEDPGRSPLRSGSCVKLDQGMDYAGELVNRSGPAPVASSAVAHIVQTDCAVVGGLILDPPLVGTGAFVGQVAGDQISFTVFAETNDAGIDLVFDGTVTEESISGSYTAGEEGGTWEIAPLAE